MQQQVSLLVTKISGFWYL